MTDYRRRVWLLTVSRVLAMGGTMAAYATLTYTVYHETGSTKWLAAVTFATISIAGLVTPASGWLADRYDRRRLMVGSDLSVAVVYVALAMANQPSALVLLGAISSVVASPFIPASRAAIPNLVPPDQLTWANSMVARAFAISFTGGPILGGILLSLIGVDGVFLLAAGMTTVSALLVAGMDGSFKATARPGEAHESGGAREGFRFISKSRLLRALIISEVVAFSGVGFAIVADAPLAKQFGVGAVGYGLLLASWGTGTLIGATVAPRLSRFGDDLFRVIMGMATIGASIATCWFLPWFWAILAVSIFGGFGGGVVEVCRQTLLQTHTPDAVRGRVFAAAEGIGSLSFAASFVVAGAIVGIVGPQASYGICGIFFMAGAALVYVLTGYRRVAPEAA